MAPWADLLRLLADRVTPAVGMVGVDGPDAVGKTWLAGELAGVLRARGRDVVVVAVDDHPRPAAERYVRGRDSPEGYYRDAVDHEALVAALRAAARPDGVVVCEGIFLLRPELRDLWDLSIRLTAPFDVRLPRALARDVPRLGTAAEVEHRYRTRYEPGQQLYEAEAHPRDHADILIDTTNAEDPTFLAKNA